MSETLPAGSDDTTVATARTDKTEPLSASDISLEHPPTAIGKYRVDGLLGRGGMGVVLSAHDTELERPVAGDVGQLVDVAVDQGGCVATSQPTTHSDPVIKVDGITHYGVVNMPGAVPVTSTRALSNATLPYIELIADEGLAGAMRSREELRSGLNVQAGKITNAAVAEALST